MASRVALLVLTCSSQCLHVGALRRRSDVGIGSCVSLKNRGAFSTVEVSVGTPPQKLDVVADTGSDNIIIASCACVDSGQCDSRDKCFRGTDKSSTFKIEEAPQGMTMNFGSGDVQAVIATDIVGLGNVTATMEDSLLLMVDKNLTPSIEIEGILGLGLPSTAQASADSLLSTQGFLETAKVHRFSVCFNDNGEDGVLNLGGRPSAGSVQLGIIGNMHWSIGLHGVTVGSGPQESAANVTAFCDPAAMKSGQATPCGAIVDSGTTLIMGPADQLAALYKQMCDAWPQCKNAPAMSSGQRNATQALVDEVEKCDTESMPTLRFHVSGAEDARQTLELPPNQYIIMDMVDAPADGQSEQRCVLAFHALDYDTESHGPVWIFGTPFFYKYTVSYDISTSPPQISFSTTGCAQCGSPKTAQSLVEGRSSSMRTLAVPPRRPNLDTSLPL